MDLQKKEFWKAFLRVFLVSLIGLIVGGLVCYLIGKNDYSDSFILDISIIVIIALWIISVYGLKEAFIVFKKRAAIRCDNLTRFGDYLFAGIRFVVIMIPPSVVAVFAFWMPYLLVAISFGSYHG
jgi:hypothetical protein